MKEKFLLLIFKLKIFMKKISHKRYFTARVSVLILVLLLSSFYFSHDLSNFAAKLKRTKIVKRVVRTISNMNDESLTGIKPVSYFNFIKVNDEIKAGECTDNCMRITKKQNIQFPDDGTALFKVNKKSITALGLSHYPLEESFSIEFLLKVNDKKTFMNNIGEGAVKSVPIIQKSASYTSKTFELLFYNYPFNSINFNVYLKDFKDCKNKLGNTCKITAKIPLDGYNQNSFDYYFDKQWHHFILSYDQSSGLAQICVDGLCPEKFSNKDSIIKGRLNNIDSDFLVGYLKNSSGIEDSDVMFMDQIAFYNKPLSKGQISKHYLDAVKNKLDYSFQELKEINNPSSISEELRCEDYYPGFKSDKLNCGQEVNHIAQLNYFPDARFKEDLLLGKLHVWSSYQYPTITPFLDRNIDDQAVNQTSIRYNWELPDEYYVRDFNGKLKVAFVEGKAIGTPISPGAPLDYVLGNTANGVYGDGKKFRDNLEIIYKLIGEKSRISYLIENDEVPPASDGKPDDFIYDKNVRDKIIDFYKLNVDKQILDNIDYSKIIWENFSTNPTSSGISQENAQILKQVYDLDWNHFLLVNKTDNFRNKFLGAIKNHPVFTSNAAINNYEIGEHRKDQWDVIHTSSDKANLSLYPHDKFNWRYWPGWIQVAIRSNTAAKSQFSQSTYWPLISTGFYEHTTDVEKDFTPAQWLGWLKSMVVSGAEHFTYITNQNDNDYPIIKWAWKFAVPAYAQAIGSQAGEEFFYCKDGRCPKLLEGDIDIPYHNIKEFSFFYNDYSYWNVVKKSRNGDKLLISTTKQTGIVSPNETVTINNVDGISSLTLPTRRQGSVYIYNKNNQSLIQLDSWHKDTHPWYWSRSPIMWEAELPAMIENRCNNIEISTDHSANDYSDFRTYLTIKKPENECESSIKYKFNLDENQLSKYALLLTTKNEVNASLKIKLNSSFIGNLDLKNENKLSNLNDLANRYDINTKDLEDVKSNWNNYINNDLLLQNLRPGLNELEISASGPNLDADINLDKIIFLKQRKGETEIADFYLRGLNSSGKIYKTLILENPSKNSVDENINIYLRKKGADWQLVNSKSINIKSQNFENIEFPEGNTFMDYNASSLNPDVFISQQIVGNDPYNYKFQEYEIKIDLGSGKSACYKFDYYPLEDCTKKKFTAECNNQNKDGAECVLQAQEKNTKCKQNIDNRICIPGKNDSDCSRLKDFKCERDYKSDRSACVFNCYKEKYTNSLKDYIEKNDIENLKKECGDDYNKNYKNDIIQGLRRMECN